MRSTVGRLVIEFVGLWAAFVLGGALFMVGKALLFPKPWTIGIAVSLAFNDLTTFYGAGGAFVATVGIEAARHSHLREL